MLESVISDVLQVAKTRRKKFLAVVFFRWSCFPDMQNGEMEKREDGKTQSQARNTKDGPFNKCRYIGT